MSYNLPRFCPNATWGFNATTFADVSVLGEKPWYVFITSLNSIYVVISANNQLQVWVQGNVTQSRIISSGLDAPMSVFVNLLDDIYIDNGKTYHQIEKWNANSTSGQAAMTTTGSCIGLFIDLNNSLYCSIRASHRVIQTSLSTNGTAPSTVAGTGVSGTDAYQLTNQQGIFVDFQFNLYVADTDNNRIQHFTYGNLSGASIPVNIASASPASLAAPTGVILDGDGYLFIVDTDHNRIIGGGPDGFRCVAACSNTASGTAPDQLHNPQSLSFDSYGNIYVADTENKRVQKFLLLTNSCSK